jgi:hypothetical protein
VQVLSANGFYIGTLDEECMPMYRISADYYKTIADAQKALDKNSFTRRNDAEIEFCSKGKPCF